jgi:hypothetical protein
VAKETSFQQERLSKVAKETSFQSKARSEWQRLPKLPVVPQPEEEVITESPMTLGAEISQWSAYRWDQGGIYDFHQYEQTPSYTMPPASLGFQPEPFAGALCADAYYDFLVQSTIFNGRIELHEAMPPAQFQLGVSTPPYFGGTLETWNTRQDAHWYAADEDPIQSTEQLLEGEEYMQRLVEDVALNALVCS